MTNMLCYAETEAKPKTNVLNGPAVRYCCQLSKHVMADVLITGPEISVKDIEMLRKYLELTKDALADQQEGLSKQRPPEPGASRSAAEAPEVVSEL